MEAKKLKELKVGEWFTKKPIEEPKESQVFIRSGYDRETKKYSVLKFNDICDDKLMKGETIVYIGFTF